MFGVWVRSRDPFRALAGAILLLLAQTFCFPKESGRDFACAIAFVRARAAAIALALAAALTVHGIALGTFAAGGADQYGYVSQAYGWASGTLPRPTPLPLTLPFPDSDLMQMPLGYTSGTQPHTMVPTYAPGLPLLMAAAIVAGPCGPFFVVPLCGGLFIWCTYLLGRRAAGTLAGALAALTVAGSPVVLYQNLNPMSDVPAGAFWTGALAFALGSRRRDTAAAAMLTAIGLLIRPNLLLLAGVPLLAVLLVSSGGERWLRGAMFCAPVIVVAITIAALNTYWYGAPSKSGYGDASDLYAWSNVWPNAKLYGSWLRASETPVVLIALLAFVPVVLRDLNRTAIAMCALMTLMAVGSYLSYFQFAVWWYLRFFLPAGGAFAVLVATGFMALARLLPAPVGRLAAAVVFALFLAARISFAEDNGSFGSMREGERRYIDVGEFVEQHLPKNAALFSMQHSGSLRFYGGRLTLRYDWVQKDWAREVPAAVERAGYHPFLVIDDWETNNVRKHWGLPDDRPLPWPERARMREPGGVTVFDLATNPDRVSPIALERGSAHWCSAMRPLYRR